MTKVVLSKFLAGVELYTFVQECAVGFESSKKKTTWIFRREAVTVVVQSQASCGVVLTLQLNCDAFSEDNLCLVFGCLPVLIAFVVLFGNKSNECVLWGYYFMTNRD